LIVLLFFTSSVWDPTRAVAQCEGVPEPLDFISPQQTNIIEDVLPPILDSFGFAVAARDSAVAVDGCGRFMVVWEVDAYAKDAISDHDDSLMIQRVAPDGVLDGAYSPLTADLPDMILSEEQRHMEPSIAISPAGNVRVSWIASCFNCRTNDPPTFNVTGEALRTDFPFDQTPPVTPAPFPEPIDYEYQDASAGESAGYSRKRGCFAGRSGIQLRRRVMRRV
jgi:hypothetical protein